MNSKKLSPGPDISPNEKRIKLNACKADHWRRNLKRFHSAINIHMRRCGDTLDDLIPAAAAAELQIGSSSIVGWIRAKAAPRSKKAFKFLGWLEQRYGLPTGYFNEQLNGQKNSPLNIALEERTGLARTQLRWHLPDDFDERSSDERLEILRWIDRNILPGATDYGRYLKSVCIRPFALRFPQIIAKGNRRTAYTNTGNCDADEIDAPDLLPESALGLR